MLFLRWVNYSEIA